MKERGRSLANAHIPLFPAGQLIDFSFTPGVYGEATGNNRGGMDGVGGEDEEPRTADEAWVRAASSLTDAQGERRVFDTWLRNDRFLDQVTVERDSLTEAEVTQHNPTFQLTEQDLWLPTNTSLMGGAVYRRSWRYRLAAQARTFEFENRLGHIRLPAGSYVVDTGNDSVIRREPDDGTMHLVETTPPGAIKEFEVGQAARVEATNGPLLLNVVMSIRPT